jgi:hypothetical protein
MNTSGYPDAVRALMADITATAQQHGVTIRYGQGKRIRLSARQYVGGYFDDANRQLVVATNLPLLRWVEVLVHESCHMDQWIQGCRYWNADLDQSYNVFDRFISGAVEPDIEWALDNIVMLEADCERRSYKKLLRYQIPVSITDYAKKANAYLLSHKAMWHYQSWYKVGPYKHRRTWCQMPDQLLAPHQYRIRNNRTDPEIFKHCFKQA